MAKKTKKFICSECSYQSTYFMGKCPSCGSLGTLKEVVEDNCNTTSRFSREFSQAKSVDEIQYQGEYRIVTGIKEFDRVYGGGIISDSVNTIAARAGAGKTTLLLEVAYEVAKLHGYTILYASAEESESQLKKKFERLFKGKKIPLSLKILSTKYIENVIQEAERLDAKLIIVDSNKAFASLEESLTSSRPGSPSQMLVCTDKIITLCKNTKHPRAAFIISQFTKDEEMAGPEEFKHAVDSCAYIDFEDSEELRILRTEKNRFAELENGIFMMQENGLISVDNPNEYFTTQRDDDEKVPGVALTVIKEGSRPLIAEIEALVTDSYAPYPTRIASCLRKDNLNILLSIITQSCGLDMNRYNVIVNTTGGLKLSSKSADLAIIMSVLSVTKPQKLSIPNDTVFIAEVGLTGELKKVQGIERRIKELDRMGYERVFIAKGNIKNKNDFKNIKIIECKNISEVWSKIKNI